MRLTQLSSRITVTRQRLEPSQHDRDSQPTPPPPPHAPPCSSTPPAQVGLLQCKTQEGDLGAALDFSPRLRWSCCSPYRIRCTTAQPLRNNPRVRGWWIRGGGQTKRARLGVFVPQQGSGVPLLPVAWLPHATSLCTAHQPAALPSLCQLPSLEPGAGTAGFFNVTARFEASSRGALPLINGNAWLYTADGTPYLYSVYPEVVSISPATGSAAGGTRVTLRGRGFPDLRRQLQGGSGGSGGWGQRERVSVWLGGAPCEVVDSTYSRWVKLRGFGGLVQGQVRAV